MEESLLRTQFVVDHSQDPLLWMDPDGRLLYVNDAACRRLGYSREELLGLTVNDIDPFAPHPWSNYFLEIKERGSFTFESSLRAKDGGTFPVEVTVNYVCYEDQEYNCATVRDISERKRAEAALRESEDRYQTLVNLSPDAIVVNSGGKYVFANPAAARLFGVGSPQELVGRVVAEMVHPDYRELVAQRTVQVLAGAMAPPLEMKFLRRDGSSAPVEASAARIEFDGSPATQVVLRDITERKRAEEALRLARFSIDFASDLTLWISPEGHLLDVSQSACARFGYSRDELLTMSVFDLTMGLSPDAWPDRWRELEQGPLIFERQYRTKSGEIFPVEISSAVLEHEGREYNLVVIRDITDRKEAEEALKQSEEQLRESQKMEAVGQLAGGIAHDFNNLLTTILGYTEMILSGEASSLEDVRPDIEEIKHAGERASALTQQILAFSRRQILRPTALSLNEVLDGMESLLRRTLGEDIDLVILEHPQLDVTEVDRHQFEQVLMNLALNARDAMPSGGRLTLETANVELDEQYCRAHPEVAPGSYVMLSVSDTGLGMDQDTMDHIFEPFFTTKAFGQGTGLGLAVIHGIVTQSRGSISVYSEPGKGASVKIYLPRAARADIPEEVTLPSHVSTAGSETVMVVEDEAALRSLIERVLGAAGYTTLAFGSAAEALEAFGQDECSVDLLLTDVMLPGALQGYDLARAVLAAQPGLPVLYISGYARNALVHAGRLDEGVNLLEKPFTPEALASAVRKVLDQCPDSFRGE